MYGAPTSVMGQVSLSVRLQSVHADGLKRYQEAGHLHFVTFSCYRRLPYLAEPGAYGVFEQVLKETRQKHDFCIAGYVLMPEHVHLLVSEPEHTLLATAIKRLKWTTSRRLRGRSEHFWQARYYDFNVYTEDKHIEKLRRVPGSHVRILGPWNCFSSRALLVTLGRIGVHGQQLRSEHLA